MLDSYGRWRNTPRGIEASGFFDPLPGNGKYIDLDGSSADAGILSRSFALLAGVQYSASFDLAGSQRSSIETVDVAFGSANATFTLAEAAGFQANTLSFKPLASGSYTLSFSNQGGDNIGALLDNVAITAVPEPSAALMCLVGLGMLGLALRRKTLTDPR